MPEPIAVAVEVLWFDQREIFETVTGRSPATIRKWNRRRGGPPIYVDGADPRKPRHFILHSEYIAHLLARSKQID
jgi:hypothetical protein